MIDSIISTQSNIQSDSNGDNHGHIHTIRTARHDLKATLNDNNNTKLVQKNNYISRLSIEQLTHNRQASSINDINLILGNITQLKSDMIDKIFSYLKSSQYGVFDKLDRDQESSQNESLNDEEVVTEHRAIIEQIIILMLIRFQYYLLECKIVQSYKIISIYEFEYKQNIHFKHMLSIIPYKSEMPMDGLSEITSYDLSGQMKRELVTSKLLNGGFSYTQNWLGLFVMNRSDQEFVQKISIPYGAGNLYGCAVNYNIDSSVVCQQTRFSMHVEEFVKYW